LVIAALSFEYGQCPTGYKVMQTVRLYQRYGAQALDMENDGIDAFVGLHVDLLPDCQ